MDNAIKPVRSRTSQMILGKTTYIVTTSFKENASETVEQKLVRYIAGRIANDANNRNMGLSAANK